MLSLTDAILRATVPKKEKEKRSGRESEYGVCVYVVCVRESERKKEREKERRERECERFENKFPFSSIASVNF